MPVLVFQLKKSRFYSHAKHKYLANSEIMRYGLKTYIKDFLFLAHHRDLDINFERNLG